MAYKIKQVRESKNLTQEELSKKAGVSRAIISKLENGDCVVTTTETICKIANALGCSIGDIFLD